MPPNISCCRVEGIFEGGTDKEEAAEALIFPRGLAAAAAAEDVGNAWISPRMSCCCKAVEGIIDGGITVDLEAVVLIFPTVADAAGDDAGRAWIVEAIIAEGTDKDAEVLLSVLWNAFKRALLEDGFLLALAFI